MCNPTHTLRTVLVWIITQKVVEIYYRFRTSYWSHVQGSRTILDSFGFLKPKDETDRLSLNVGKKVPQLTA